ncbi:hypothetical protein C5468_05670 [Photorhabdus luminescens subsp. mexicana]|uniref:Uncharacterized protein n=1 Tax=Photorhabdus luminescens subsp. mexicana TaxID=2100167 RepID=A0A4V2X6Z8_PHOLU|nr:hypothetical protein C5468_05670 [Photorhabdus luminescens subsp. mexicana]
MTKQRTEDRGQRTEDRGQRTEDRENDSIWSIGNIYLRAQNLVLCLFDYKYPHSNSTLKDKLSLSRGRWF